jgi:hypothetical protein
MSDRDEIRHVEPPRAWPRPLVTEDQEDRPRGGERRMNGKITRYLTLMVLNSIVIGFVGAFVVILVAEGHWLSAALDCALLLLNGAMLLVNRARMAALLREST